MWPFTGGARNQLAQSHTAVSQLVVLRGGIPAYTLAAVNGSISADSERSVMWNFTAEAIDENGLLSGADVDDLLNPYNCEVVAYRGVTVPGANTEYAPLGVYQLTNRDVGGDGSVTITGQDRSIMYQGGMTGALSVSAGTSIESAIQQLLMTRNKGLRWRPKVTGQTCGPLLYAPDIDVWKEAQTLAQAAGGRLYHDRVGFLIFGTSLPTNVQPVRGYGQGDGLLLSVDRQEDSDTIKNVVVVEQQAGSSIRAVAKDTNSNSPTYAGGKYGYRVITITNANLSTIAQAQQLANNELIRQLGRSETVSLTVVPDPTLDVMEAIYVNRPSADLTNSALVIQSLTYPLAVTDSMQINCRKFLLTEDGAQDNSTDPLTTS